MASNQSKNTDVTGAGAVSSPGVPVSAKAARLLGWASWLVVVEAIALAAFALFLLWGLLSGQAKEPAGELLLVILFGAAAAWIFYAAVALRRGARWARSATLFWQTCQLFLATQSFTGRGANWTIGGFLVGTSLVILVLIFNPAVLAESKRQIETEK